MIPISVKQIASTIAFVMVLVLIHPLILIGGNMETRKPIVSGQFYPGSPETLKKTVQNFLNKAASKPNSAVRAIVVPHAGYPYSGPVAAESFKSVQGLKVDTIIVVGFTHQTPIRGVFVETAQACETPLGKVPVNQTVAKQIRDFNPLLNEKPLGDLREHSIEVQIPFLQETFKNFSIVPVYIGTQNRETAAVLADALAKVAQDPKTLFVFSTDLCHYEPDSIVKQRDSRLISLLEESNPDDLATENEQGKIEACGIGPLLTFLRLQQKMGWAKPKLLKQATSGDITGDRSSVVGYAALEVSGSTEPKDPTTLADTDKKKLLEFVRSVLRARLTKDIPEPKLDVSAKILDENRGVFVTLRKHGDLRGCIGRIISNQPVRAILKDITLDSALRDPRFPPVKGDELNDLQIEISILTIPTPVSSYKDVRLGTDGIIVEYGFKGGVFLPDVATETGWNQETFFLHCARDKAGLGENEIPKAKISIFQTEAFQEGAEKK